MGQNQECILMNVKISNQVRRFAGILNEFHNYEFNRFFGILTDEATGLQLRRIGFRTRIRKIQETRTGEFPVLMHVSVDYGYNTPEIEAILDDRSFSLDESTIGSLDHMNIDYANLIVDQVVRYDENGEAYMAAYLKSMKVYLKSELEEYFKMQSDGEQDSI